MVEPLVVALPWLLEPEVLVYASGFFSGVPALTLGLLNVVCWALMALAALLPATVLLPTVSLLLLFVALLRVVTPLPVVPRLVLEIVPEPLLNVVRPLSANTLVSRSVSCLGTYVRFFEMCPPWPIPGPPWNP